MGIDKLVYIEDSPMGWVHLRDVGRVGMYMKRDKEFRPDYSMMLFYGWEILKNVTQEEVIKFIEGKIKNIKT